MQFDSTAVNSALQLASQALLNVDTFFSAAAEAAVTLAGGSRCNVGLLNVTLNSRLSYSLGAANATLNFSSLALAGQLSVVGAGSVLFPRVPGAGSGTGVVSLSGGPSLSGFLTGGSSISLLTAAGTAGEAFAMVAAGASFFSSGNINSTSATARFEVGGRFTFNASSVTARLAVAAGGVFAVLGRSLSCGALNISTSGRIELSSNSNGDSTVFASVSSCVAGAIITKNLTGSFAAGTAASSGTVFTYSSAVSSPPLCVIILVDSTGAKKLLNTTGVAAGTQDHHHVFAAMSGHVFESGSAGSATWGNSKLTYSTGAGAAVAPFFALAVVLMFLAL